MTAHMAYGRGRACITGICWVGNLVHQTLTQSLTPTLTLTLTMTPPGPGPPALRRRSCSWQRWQRCLHAYGTYDAMWGMQLAKVAMISAIRVRVGVRVRVRRS